MKNIPYGGVPLNSWSQTSSSAERIGYLRRGRKRVRQFGEVFYLVAVSTLAYIAVVTMGTPGISPLVKLGLP